MASGAIVWPLARNLEQLASGGLLQQLFAFRPEISKHLLLETFWNLCLLRPKILKNLLLEAFWSHSLFRLSPEILKNYHLEAF